MTSLVVPEALWQSFMLTFMSVIEAFQNTALQKKTDLYNVSPGLAFTTMILGEHYSSR